MVWQQENRLIYEDFLIRYKIIVFFLLSFFFLLSARLFYIQVLQGSFYNSLSEQQRTHIVLERAPRGIIYDCNGEVLVGNKTAFVALFYPFSQSSNRPSKDVLRELKNILSRKDLSTTVAKGWRSGQVVRLSNDLSRLEMFKLQEQRLMLPGISVVKESRRNYYDPEANSHLVGYLSEITLKELEDIEDEGYKSGDWIGRGGLEQIYDTMLRGQDGGWQIEVDALGRQTKLVRHILPTIGNSLHTTIDARLQRIAEEGFKNSPSGRGALVAIDPRTGAVKAFVSSPGFNPNYSFSREFSKYLIDKQLPLFNRILQGLYAPGSTFKIVTFVGALTEAGISPDLTYHCPGYFVLGNKTFNCWYKKGHGNMSLMSALINSCNVYFYQIGLKIGPKTIEKYARMFHLGEKTNIEFPSEKKGLIPNAEWKQKKMHENWQQGDTVNIAIGQGPIWVTPIQMAQLIATVANSGTLYKPYIVDSITTQKGDKIYQSSVRKEGEVILPDTVWELLHKGLEEVVNSGTGRGCIIPDIQVAGKTGTAQNPHGEDHAWFVSYAPADNPEIAMAIIVENGGHGGTAAVPIAKQIYETYFGLNKNNTEPNQVNKVETEEETSNLDEGD